MISVVLFYIFIFSFCVLVSLEFVFLFVIRKLVFLFIEFVIFVLSNCKWVFVLECFILLSVFVIMYVLFLRGKLFEFGFLIVG